MSESAFTAVSSNLSGTMAATILPKRLLSLMKKKLMNTTENIPIPRLDTIDAADPITDENTDGSRNFFSSSKRTISILKSSPSLGNVLLRYWLKSARGMDMLRAVFSMLPRETPLTIPLTTGTMRVTTTKNMITMMASVNEASSQSGAFFPLILTFWSSAIIGWAISDTTTARRMYMITLLKYQHTAAPIPIQMASKIYLASFSLYFSFSIARKFKCATLWYNGAVPLHQQNG